MMRPIREVVVLGAGGHAKIVVAALRAADMRPVAVFDDDARTWGSRVLEVTVRAGLAEAAALGLPGVIAVGDNAQRAAIASRVQLDWVTLVHPAAHADDSARIGQGALICAGAIIQPDAILGAHVIANTGCSIDHDCEVGDYAHIAPGVHLGGGVRIGARTLVGIGACVLPRVRLGERCIVGGGAAVIEDVPDGCTVVGVPARVLARAAPSNTPAP